MLYKQVLLPIYVYFTPLYFRVRIQLEIVRAIYQLSNDIYIQLNTLHYLDYAYVRPSFPAYSSR